PMTPSSAGIKIPFTEHLGVQLVEMTKEHAVVSLQKRPELLNSWGATHGGVVMTMLDLVMSWAVRGYYGIVGGVLTVDLSVGFMKAGLGDKVTAEGRVLHGGKSTAFSPRRSAPSSCSPTRRKRTGDDNPRFYRGAATPAPDLRPNSENRSLLSPGRLPSQTSCRPSCSCTRSPALP
ncbi:MAG: PaaI family thioesterase, partial [Betaproteobacteria bacterium]